MKQLPETLIGIAGFRYSPENHKVEYQQTQWGEEVMIRIFCSQETKFWYYTNHSSSNCTEQLNWKFNLNKLKICK